MKNSNSEVRLLHGALSVLITHGLHDHCEGSPNWTGNPGQQAALNALHQALADYLPDLPGGQEHNSRRIVCLCGSTRFKQEFIQANFQETMKGNIVLSVGCFGHADGDVYALTPEEKTGLDELHLRKIEMADEVLVINVGGYVGSSTSREIAHAGLLGRNIRLWEPAPTVEDEAAQ